MPYREFKQCVRYNVPGHAHSLTFSCYQYLPLLESTAAKQLVVDSLQAARARHCFDIWAYVIMQEHVHLFIWPRKEIYDISTMLAAIKRPVAFRARIMGLSGEKHFWQRGGGYDRNIWLPGAIHNEVAYLHGNPVRRGLCRNLEDWRYSSAGFWAGQRDVPLLMDETLPPKLKS